MILAQAELRKAVAEGRISFDPTLDKKQWGEASIDLRLGHQFTKLKRSAGVTISLAEEGLTPLEESGRWASDDLSNLDPMGKERSFEITPNEFVLAQTYERVTVPRNMIARVEGRSTYARVGLSMHQTAPWIQPGWSGHIILELMNNGPLNIKLTPVKDRPCQITFFELTSEVPENLAYGSKTGDTYQHQQHPIVPKTR